MISEKQVWAALPSSGFLRSYVEWAHTYVEANDAFHVVAALALLSQSVPIEFSFPGVSRLYSNFFGLVTGPSSISGKTQSIKAAREVLDLALPESEMKRPGSPEACIDLLNGSNQLLFYDEFGQVLQATAAGQLAPLRTVLTDVYDCGKQSRALVKRRGEKARKDAELNPRLSILAGGTPGFIEAFTTAVDWGEGFLARFFTILATRERTIEAEFGPAGESERARLAALLKSYAPLAGEQGIFAKVEPQPCAGRTRDAQGTWKDWKGKLEARAMRAPVAVQAAMFRAQGHAIKVSMLLAWDAGAARSGNDWRISSDDMSSAIAITELHIESVLEIAEGLASDRDGRDERAFLLAFKSGRDLTYGEALRFACLNDKRGKECFRTLLEKGYLNRIDGADITEVPRYRYVDPERGNVIPIRPGSKIVGLFDTDS